LIDWLFVGLEIRSVSDDIPLAAIAHECLDPVPEPKSTIAEVSEAVKGTSARRPRSDSDAIEGVLTAKT
jgi:hypothetical protein